MSEPTCRLCGCTETNACYDEERGACGWAAPGVCTHCADSIALLGELLDGGGRAEPVPEGTEVGEISLPVHHAEQLRRVIDYGRGDEDRTQAERDVLAERARQVDEEGWTPEHDDQHESGEMAAAGAAYAFNAYLGASPRYFHASPTGFWPWDMKWWRPSTPRRDLEKACALLIAEIERLDRAEARKAEQG